MKSKPKPQHYDSSGQPLSMRNIEGLSREWETQQEHAGIELRTYELFEARGCEHGHEWEDWFRAKLELHLNE
jgi:hypothetical protein